jgi:subtilisin-like proprotein convertase family protein
MICLAIAFQAGAQNITNYTFSATSGTFTALSGGNTMALSGGTLDDGYFNAIPIGFTFYYMGVPYTTISSVTNGWLTFDQTLTASGVVNNLTSGTPRPVIAPLWDDLELQSNTHFSYLTTGSSPNRVFTAEWLYMFWNYTATDSVISFQAKLYEASGKVEFIYKDAGAAVVSGTASIGICGIPTGSGNFLSLDGTGTSPLASSTTETTTLNTKPANGQTYAFTPVQNITPAAPLNLSFSGIGGTNLTVNWNDNSTTETYFVVARSDDGGVTYPYITSVLSTTTAGTGAAYNLPVTGLSVGATYYFRVTANNEASAPSVYIQGSQATNPGSLSGTKNIPGDYATLTAAFADINTNGLAGNINLVLGSTYTSAGETFPIAGPTAGSMGAYTATVYPAATGLSITSSNATGTIDLSGSKNIIFDGRVNATGSVKDLLIENTATTGFTIRFINDALNNTFKYCTLKGVSTSTTGGVILFSTTTGISGNDNNTIDYCDIRDGATTPTNCVYSAGTTTTSNHYNSFNTISNCNIFNYYNSTSTSNGGIGINMGTGNTDWTFTGNSFYQTAARATFAGGTTNAILFSSNTGNNHLISGNYIGGSEPLCAGSPYTVSSNVIFRGIQATLGAITPTSIQGNTLRNISITTSNASTAQSCLSLVTGSFDVGTVTGNTIGSNSTTGSIVFIHSSTSTGPIFSGILVGTGTPGIVNISNNTVGGIAVSTTSTATVSVRGIGVQGAATSYNISNNTVGSASVANSITNSTNQSLIGIFSASISATNIITNNLVANLAQTGTTTSNTLRGLLIQGSTGGAFTTTDNTVRNLTSSSASTGTGSTASVIGISHTAATTAGQTLARNTIYDLSNTTGTAASGVVGIYYGGPTTGTNLVARNFVYGLSLSTSSATGFMTGIHAGAGLTTFQNNMVAIGNNVTSGYLVTGINDLSGTNSYYFNSVYIGGTNVGGTSATYAFNSSVTSNVRNFKDNIFFNARSNGSGTGKHYAVKYAGTGVNPTGLSANYNLLYANGTGNVFGYYNADITSIGAWQSATGQDFNSINANPNYNGPTNSPPDLHIHATNPTPIESAGTDIAGITDDYDGQTRADYTPVDIGADAGNFTGADLSGPVIAYSQLPNTSSTSSRPFTNVSITDISGVNITAGTSPRVYYKRKSDANTYVDNLSTSNGWKYDEANGTTSPFDFTIDYSLLSGGTGVTIGDTLQYFVVAQDLATIPNVGINTGSFSAQPVSVDLTAAAFPITGTINSYRIVNAFAGAYNIGAGQTYRCLTADADTGFFKAINNGVVSGNITVNVISDLTETGAIALNQWPEEGTGNYTMTIKPDAANLRTISGSYAGGLIRLNGADRVTIDGRSGGSGKYLTFTNTNTSGAVFQLISLGNNAGATDNTIRNCNINMGGNASGTYGIAIGGATVATTGADNDYLTIQENIVSKAYYGIWIGGISGGLDNNNLVQGNTIGSSTTGNEIKFCALYLTYVDNSMIKLNDIFGITQTSSFDAVVATTGVTNTSFSRNKVYNMINNGTNRAAAFAVSSGTSSNLTYDNNLIYGIINNGTAGNTFGCYGFYITAGGGYNIYYNSIYMSGDRDVVATTKPTSISAAIYISAGATLNLRNNILENTQTAATNTPKSYAIYSGVANTAYTAINFNDYYVAGTQGMLGYLTADQATLAAWQAATLQDANSINADPLFGSTTDLIPGLGSPVLAAGTPVAGVDYDYMNADRSDTNPTMGAYENSGDFSGPAITYALLGNTTSASNRSFTNVGITDVSGVNTTAGTRPRVYYKRSTDGNVWNDNTPGTDGWKYKEANGASNPFDFTIDYSKLNGGTGVVQGDVVQYFVVAQDLQAIPNVSINSGTFTAQPASVDLTAAAFPISGTINSYQISVSYSGTINVGPAETFKSLTADAADGLFKALNNGVLTGNLTVNIMADLTETGAISLNQLAEEPAGSNFTVTIQPNASTSAPITTVKTISGAYAGGLIRLNGADRVTIDGRSGGSGNYLTFINTATTSTIAAIQLISLGNNLGATSNTIRNCNISTGFNATGAYAIVSGSATVATTGADNDNNTIRNNNISKAYVGIWAQGSATTNPGLMDNIQILENTVGSDISTDYIGHDGIFVANGTGGVIAQNTIYNLIPGTTVTTPVGMTISTGFINATVSRNRIHDIIYTGTGGYGGRGMYINTGNSSSNLTIDNNLIYVIGGDGYTSFGASSPVGMYFDGTMSGLKIYYNSVYMSGNTSYSTTSAILTTAILFNTSTITNIDLRDNIFQNSMDCINNTNDKNYAIYSLSPAASFTNIDYNDYYANGPQGILGFLVADKLTLAEWQAATLQDVNSISDDPLFNSTTDLQVSGSSPVIGEGTPISGLDYDFDNADRSNSAPSMGAYEGVTASCPRPTALDVTDLFAHSANLTWTAGGTETAWEYKFGLSPMPVPTSPGTYTTSRTTNLVSGLTGGTIYQYYARAICAEFDTSEWSAPRTFTTLVSCPAPTPQPATNLSSSSAYLSWLPGGEESSYNVEVGPVGFEPGNDEDVWSVTGIAGTSVTASPLEANTDYQYYVQSNCGFDQPKRENFWFEINELEELLPYPASGGGPVDEPGEDGFFYFYQTPETSWYNVWWYNGELDMTRMKIIRMGFWVQRLNQDAPANITYVVNWSDQYWTGTGFPTPDPADTAFIERSPVNYLADVLPNDAEHPDGYWVELYYVIPDYNPEWVSVDVWGQNVTVVYEVIAPPETSALYSWWLTDPQRGGILLHECLPKPLGDASAWAGPIAFTTLLAPFPNPTGCNVNVAITSNACKEIEIDVTGAPGTQLGSDVEFESVSLIIDHSFDGDLDIFLISPNNVEVELSTDNGSTGDDYGDPTNCPSAVTTFRMDATTLITAGTAPFIGSYIPEGNLTNFHDGSNPNGLWKLRVCDDATGDEGTLIYAALTFREPCTAPGGQSADNETTVGADLHWNGQIDSFFDIFLQPAGGPIPTPATSPTVNDVPDDQYTWAGGEPNTTYDWYVREDCGEDNLYVSGWTGPDTFTTDVLCTTNTWTGAISNEWNIPGNWSCGIVPTASLHVIIPAGITLYPVIPAGYVAECYSLTVEPGATITVREPGGALIIVNP